jgi:hypothetical protein
MSSQRPQTNPRGAPLCGPAAVMGLICARSHALDLPCEAGILVETLPNMRTDGGSKCMCMAIREEEQFLLPEEIGEKAKK